MSVPSTLGDIRKKVRRLTGSPRDSQLTDSTIDENVNVFYTYDMPQQLKLFNLKEELEFYTQPNIDAYVFPRNEYRTTSPPLYIGGYESFWSQSREQFFRSYPQTEFTQDLSFGNGTTGPYELTFINKPFFRGYTAPGSDKIFSQVSVSGVDTNGNNQIARDNGEGLWINEAGSPLSGSVNYITGEAVINFAAPITGIIRGHNIPYVASRPQGLLFFNDLFFLRPVPDQAYKVSMEAFKTPVALISSGQQPELNEWWQYLAFGASKKILEDRLDVEGLSIILPLLEEQQRLILRRTLVQISNERTPTIYSGGTGYFTNNNGFNNL